MQHIEQWFVNRRFHTSLGKLGIKTWQVASYHFATSCGQIFLLPPRVAKFHNLINFATSQLRNLRTQKGLFVQARRGEDLISWRGLQSIFFEETVRRIRTRSDFRTSGPTGSQQVRSSETNESTKTRTRKHALVFGDIWQKGLEMWRLFVMESGCKYNTGETKAFP